MASIEDISEFQNLGLRVVSQDAFAEGRPILCYNRTDVVLNECCVVYYMFLIFVSSFYHFNL